MLGFPESEKVKLISREISFAEFQPIYDHDIPQRHRQTDGQTDGQLALAIVPRNTALRYGSRGKNRPCTVNQ